MYRITKRALDVSASVIGLAVLSPLILLIALAIRLTLGEPALFRQQRPGYREKPFTLLKFRTMRTATDARGAALPDAERLTWLGHVLRKTSLDEIPQLWNVLRGEMSLVGPRPLLMEYLRRYTEEQKQRHLAPPGITGWAQIHGRQEITFSQRIAFDQWYVHHCSFALDIRILLETVVKVCIGMGVRSGQDVRLVDDLKTTEGGNCACTPSEHPPTQA
jgi:lipopolysaccharide/colanic/teichoic acid biosynthesis glycosyltransferase